jgi:hypothetical protein
MYDPVTPTTTRLDFGPGDELAAMEDIALYDN